MGAPRMFCPATALLGGQRTVRVNFTFELGEKRLASSGGQLARIVTRVSDVGPDPATEGHLFGVNFQAND
jgi:hypothetical protein